MIGIPFIKDLFRNILLQSSAIGGRFHICPHWAKELNNINIDEVIPNAVPQADKYPVALLMPPVQRGQFQLVEQRTKDTIEISMLFLTPAHYTGANKTLMPSASNQSTHTVDETWHDMQRAAKDFLKVLDQVIMNAGLQNSIYIDAREQQIIPVTNMGNDKACGVYVKFSLGLATTCEIEDYPKNYIGAITVPELTDSHPQHNL